VHWDLGKPSGLVSFFAMLTLSRSVAGLIHIEYAASILTLLLLPMAEVPEIDVFKPFHLLANASTFGCRLITAVALLACHA